MPRTAILRGHRPRVVAAVGALALTAGLTVPAAAAPAPAGLSGSAGSARSAAQAADDVAPAADVASVTYGEALSRTVPAEPGTTVLLQQRDGGAWRTVGRWVAGPSGEVRVTTPVVDWTEPLEYRVVAGTTSGALATVDAAPGDAVTALDSFTVLPAAPYMPPQTYNGEVKEAVGAWGNYTNGTIPVEVLCAPSWAGAHRSRCDADAAFEEMNAAYRAQFGVNMTINSSYRTYEQQVEMKERLGRMAATPGTSKHGWGLAIDFGGGINTFGSEQHNWMRSNANRFGWYHPSWAQFSGSLPEPWHWEYAGAVASGRTDQANDLALELTRTQPWDNAGERSCLSELWKLRTGWSYTFARSGTDQRGIPTLSMTEQFGSSWTSSSAAAVYLRNPQTQIEYGLRDLTGRFGSACRAWQYWGPAVEATPTGPTTVRPGGTVGLAVTYLKERLPVASASLTLQRLVAGEWTDVEQVAVVDGAAAFTLDPGATSGTYRVRNWNAGAFSATVTVGVAEVTASLTGPGTVPEGGTTGLAITYAKDSTPVPSAVVTLQELRDGAWVDTVELDVVDGVVDLPLTPTASTTLRVRNWNSSAVSEPVRITVAELRATLTGPATVGVGGSTSAEATYRKDGRPVPAATVVLQQLVDDAWVDAADVPVVSGTGTATLAPGEKTATYRFRNYDGGALSPVFTVTVIRPVKEFSDVAPDHPLLASINWVVERGIADGYADGSFRPTAAVSRQAMAAFLYRLAGEPQHTPPTTSPFVDVAPGHPFYEEITWLAAEGISTGTALPGGGMAFEPEAPVSRQAMAAFLHRYADSPAATPSDAFADVPTDHSFATAIAWLAAEGISTGTAQPDGSRLYEPTLPVSRQAMAAFLERMSTAD